MSRPQNRDIIFRIVDEDAGLIEEYPRIEGDMYDKRLSLISLFGQVTESTHKDSIFVPNENLEIAIMLAR